MIIDHIRNIMWYQDILPNLKEGIEELNKKKVWKVGKYQFEGGYFMIQEGVTRPIEEGTFETHQNYIDVQILLEGCEEIAWMDSKELKSVIPYNEEKDQERLEGLTNHRMLISKDMFYVAFPHDGHKAVSHTEGEHNYRKIVMKLKIEK